MRVDVDNIRYILFFWLRDFEKIIQLLAHGSPELIRNSSWTKNCTFRNRRNFTNFTTDMNIYAINCFNHIDVFSLITKSGKYLTGQGMVEDKMVAGLIQPKKKSLPSIGMFPQDFSHKFQSKSLNNLMPSQRKKFNSVNAIGWSKFFLIFSHQIFFTFSIL